MSRKRKKKASENNASFVENGLAEKLRQVTKNLYYISETDAEILPFTGQSAASVTKDEVLRQTGRLPGEKIEERDFDQIFDRLTKIQDWFGDEETETAKKFAVLRDLLSENLTDLKVFKVGEIELDIFFVGLDEQRRLIGIKTKAVET